MQLLKEIALMAAVCYGWLGYGEVDIAFHTRGRWGAVRVSAEMICSMTIGTYPGENSLGT